MAKGPKPAHKYDFLDNIYKTTPGRRVVRQQNVANIIGEASWRSKQFQVKEMLSNLKIRSG